jgi:hypothetical protein
MPWVGEGIRVGVIERFRHTESGELNPPLVLPLLPLQLLVLLLRGVCRDPHFVRPSVANGTHPEASGASRSSPSDADATLPPHTNSLPVGPSPGASSRRPKTCDGNRVVRKREPLRTHSYTRAHTPTHEQTPAHTPARPHMHARTHTHARTLARACTRASVRACAKARVRAHVD